MAPENLMLLAVLLVTTLCTGGHCISEISWGPGRTEFRSIIGSKYKCMSSSPMRVTSRPRAAPICLGVSQEMSVILGKFHYAGDGLKERLDVRSLFKAPETYYSFFGSSRISGRSYAG